MRKLARKFFSKFMDNEELIKSTSNLWDVSKNELLQNIPITEKLCFLAMNPTKSFNNDFVTGIITPPRFSQYGQDQLIQAGINFVRSTQMVPVLMIHVSRGYTVDQSISEPVPTGNFEDRGDSHQCIAINAGAIDGRAAGGMIVFDQMEDGGVQIIIDDNIYPNKVMRLYSSLEELRTHGQQETGVFNSYITAFFDGIEKGANEQFANDDRFFE